METVKAATVSHSSSLIKFADETDQSAEIYKPLVWLPERARGGKSNLSRQDVRTNVHFQEFKQFLVHQTENGYLNRQEAVSMLPPLLLGVQVSPQSNTRFIFCYTSCKPFFSQVLDMCASPGSKTAQLIEYLHNDGSHNVNTADSTIVPSGFVVANDLDNKRCYMLMHQLKRLQSPNFMIVNHDASALPNFRVEVSTKTKEERRIFVSVLIFFLDQRRRLQELVL